MQLYEQILAENEKLKAQLRDTDLELADLKLQLEKATQVRLSRRAARNTNDMICMMSSLTSFFSLCVFLQRQERFADRSQLEMEKRVTTAAGRRASMSCNPVRLTGSNRSVAHSFVRPFMLWVYV